MKIVLSGPPHSGKTSTLNALKFSAHWTQHWNSPKDPQNFISESAIALINSLRELCGPNFDQWRTTYNPAWQSLVATMQLKLERDVSKLSIKTITWIDSSPLDSLAFCRAYGGQPDQYLLDICAESRYDHVFYLELIQPFNERTNTGRLQTLDDCLKIGSEQLKVYAEYGLSPISVPQLPLPERLAFIYSKI